MEGIEIWGEFDVAEICSRGIIVTGQLKKAASFLHQTMAEYHCQISPEIPLFC
jgi:hypothetical protein